jgi:hypothetical protein
MSNTAQQPGPPAAVEEVVCLTKMLERSQWEPIETSFIKRNIQILREATLAGLQRVPEDFALSLRLIDPMLRARWDFVCDMWAIERWVEEDDFCRWALIAYRFKLNDQLIADLKRGDTWKDGKDPREILREKREAAEKQKELNEKKGDEKVLAAVDSLPSENLKRMIQVENAVASGEQITARGSDALFLDRQQRALRDGKGSDLPANPAPYGRKRFKLLKERN